MGDGRWLLRVLPVATAIVGTAFATASPRTASADPASVEAQDKQGCIDAFKRAQRLRRRGELLSARAELIVCGQPQCPDMLEIKCIEWVEEVRQAIPTVVVSARNEQGHDITQADVTIDDEVIASALDGLPLELDPGAHEVRVTREGRSIAQRIVATQGAKNRLLVLRFPPAAPPTGAVRSERPPLPVLGWIGFGLGATGLIVGTATGIASLAEAKKLDCPNDTCFQFQADALSTGRALAHTSTASFVLAGVGTGLGVTALTWLRPSPSAVARMPLRPTLGLGTVGFEGSF